MVAGSLHRVSNRTSPYTYSRRVLHLAQDDLSQKNCMGLQVSTSVSASKKLGRIILFQTEWRSREVSCRILRFSSVRYLSPSLHAYQASTLPAHNDTSF